VDSPVATLADAVVGLPYADEKSVVQTRFATTALVYLLSSLGIELGDAVEQARRLSPPPSPRTSWTRNSSPSSALAGPSASLTRPA